MTNNEFSDTFSTLLNSYNTQAHFGEEASKREIVLDEYEKSVLLTQAQDIIVKTYFDSTLNNQAQGFDDTTRRQVDFSSLIKVATLVPKGDNSTRFDNRGIIYQMPRKKVLKSNVIIDGGSPDTHYYEGIGDDTDMNDTNQPYVFVKDTTDVLFILNEKLNAKTVVRVGDTVTTEAGYYPAAEGDEGALRVSDTTDAENHTIAVGDIDGFHGDASYLEISDPSTPRYVVWKDATTTRDVTYNNHGLGKDYVVVPISYKEYDREMSKPFAQPLKKQAWRLFQNNIAGFDVNSELIPKWTIRQMEGITSDDHIPAEGDIYLEYRIRYVKRPRPIILEDLPDDLVIDGENQFSTCELHPILHMDILNKAVELAIQTRGNGIVPNGSANLQGQPQPRQSQRD